MFGLVVRFELVDGTQEAFDRLTTETVAGIEASEPGTLLYHCSRVEDSPRARVFYEVYANRAAFEEHERQPHVARFLQERQQYLASTPRVDFLEPVFGKGLPR